jgi:dihydrolipoamide dehydrogenase
MGSLREECELVVIGGGPGGYVAALRAADLGIETILIEERERPGGVCLLEGCIPSKTLIHAVELIHQARDAAPFGLSFKDPEIDLEKLQAFTNEVVGGLVGGVEGLLKRRGVELIKGRARFDGKKSLALAQSDTGGVDFKHAIIASGSRARTLDVDPELELWTSREALALPRLPDRLVVVGGGYIGLELGMVYAGLGSEVRVVEFTPRVLIGADEDLVSVVVKRAKSIFKDIQVDSKVLGIEKSSDVYRLKVRHKGEEQTLEADAVLMAVGREPNTDDMGLSTLDLAMTEDRRIKVDKGGHTSISNIYAIGDVTPGPMLAHKASREGKVAAEVIAGQPSAFDNRAIPAVVFTDPELAWAGLTETEAKQQGRKVNVGRFPLSALGRARTLGRTDGLVKILSEPADGRILGVGMVGPHVSELIAEGTLAMEMGATLEDLMVTIHPHPTISEALMEAAEVAAGHPIHISKPK